MSMGYQNGGNQDSKAQDRQADKPADWDTLKDDVQGVAGAAFEQGLERGRGFVNAARGQATDYVDQRKNAVAQSVTDLAQSLRETGKTFEDKPNIHAFVDNAAEGLEQLAGTIRERSFAEMFNDAEVVIRQRPALFGAVALTAGFVLARFIKASSEGMRDLDRQMTRHASRAGGQRPPA
jgi:hypothetical protein